MGAVLADLMRSLSTKGRGERRLQKVNGKPFCPRRAAKDHEGPRRTSTATAELQRLHLFPRRTRRATENGNCRKGNCRRSTAKTFIHEGPRRTAKGREERQLQLQNCNGYTFFHGGHEGPRRTATAEGQRQTVLSTKGREGPRRTATAELQRLHLFVCGGHLWRSRFWMQTLGVDCGRRTGVSGEKRAMAASRRAAWVTFSMVYTEFQRFLVTNDKLRR